MALIERSKRLKLLNTLRTKYRCRCLTTPVSSTVSVSEIPVINCSRTKFEEIIVNVYDFYDPKRIYGIYFYNASKGSIGGAYFFDRQFCWSIFLIAASASQPAIIALLFFFTIQRIRIVLGRCLFYDSKRSIGF